MPGAQLPGDARLLGEGQEAGRRHQGAAPADHRPVMEGGVGFKNVFDESTGYQALDGGAGADDIPKARLLLEDDEGAHPPAAQPQDGLVEVVDQVLHAHVPRLADELADGLAAAAQPFQHPADLRSEEDEDDDDDGTGLEDGIQKPAEGVQAQKLGGRGGDDQEPDALEHLIGAGVLGPDDELIDQHRQDGYVEKVVPAELAQTAPQGFYDVFKAQVPSLTFTSVQVIYSIPSLCTNCHENIKGS